MKSKKNKTQSAGKTIKPEKMKKEKFQAKAEEELELFSTGLSLPFSFEGFLISVEAPSWVLVSRLYLESLASCSLLPL